MEEKIDEIENLKIYEKEEEKDLIIESLKTKLEDAKQKINRAKQKITKLKLALIKHQISYEKLINTINDINEYFQNPYETGIETKPDPNTEKLNQILKEEKKENE